MKQPFDVKPLIVLSCPSDFFPSHPMFKAIWDHQQIKQALGVQPRWEDNITNALVRNTLVQFELAEPTDNSRFLQKAEGQFQMAKSIGFSIRNPWRFFVGPLHHENPGLQKTLITIESNQIQSANSEEYIDTLPKMSTMDGWFR